MSKPQNTNFHIKAPFPIDARMQVATFANLDAIPVKYNHLVTHVEDEDNDYKYYTATGTWELVVYGGNVSWGDIIGSITNQTDLINEFNKYALVGHTHPAVPYDHTHVEVDITDLNKYTQEEVDLFLLYKNQVITGDIVQGNLVMNVTPGTFDIGAGIGVKTVWSPTDPLTPPVTYQVEYPQTLGIALTNLATASATYVGLSYDENLDTVTVVQSTTPFSASARRSIIYKGVIEHSDNATINAVHNVIYPSGSQGQNFQDLVKSIKNFNVSGNVYSSNGANLSLDKSSGSIFVLGSGYSTPNSPNIKSVIFDSIVSFSYKLQDGTLETSTSAINPNFYDLAGVKTNTPTDKWTIQRIYLDDNQQTIVQYGQNLYDTFNEALTEVELESFIVEPYLENNAILRGYVIIQEGSTDLSIPAQGVVVDVDNWGRAKKRIGIAAAGSTDYISNVVLAGNSLNFTGIGSAFASNIDLSTILGASVFTGLTDTPGSLGTAGQVVAVNGAGTALEFINAIGGGLNNIVEDLTPQLGADLDNNGFAYGLGGFIDLTSTFANSFEFQYGGVSRLEFDIGSSANVLISSILNSFSFNKPVNATTLSITGGTANDILLGNGTTGSLSDYVTLNTVQTITALKTINTAGASNGLSIQNTGVFAGLFGTNTSTGRGINISNTSTGDGIRVTNASSGKGFVSENSGTGINFYSVNNVNNGKGIVSNSISTATGNLFEGQDNGTATFTVSRTGKGYFADNVGIGNFNDFYKLEVTGDTYLNGNVVTSGNIVPSNNLNVASFIRGYHQLLLSGGTNITLDSTHIGIIYSCSAAMTITVPANATTAIPVGSRITLLNSTTSTGVDVVAAGGVTIRANSGLNLNIPQYARRELIKIGTNTWMICR